MADFGDKERYETAWWMLFQKQNKMMQRSITLEPHSRHNNSFFKEVIALAEDPEQDKMLQNKHEEMVKSLVEGNPT